MSILLCSAFTNMKDFIIMHAAKSTSLVGDGIGSLAIHYNSQWPIYSTQTQGVANVWTVTKHLHKLFSTVC